MKQRAVFLAILTMVISMFMIAYAFGTTIRTITVQGDGVSITADVVSASTAEMVSEASTSVDYTKEYTAKASTPSTPSAAMNTAVSGKTVSATASNTGNTYTAARPDGTSAPGGSVAIGRYVVVRTHYETGVTPACRDVASMTFGSVSDLRVEKTVSIDGIRPLGAMPVTAISAVRTSGERSFRRLTVC